MSRNLHALLWRSHECWNVSNLNETLFLTSGRSDIGLTPPVQMVGIRQTLCLQVIMSDALVSRRLLPLCVAVSPPPCSHEMDCGVE